MIITIDTSKATKEEIRKVIEILQEASGEQNAASPKPEKKQPPASEDLLNMIASPGLAGQPPKKGEADAIPKSAKEAYELAEELETY
ncbi:hypothetical protein HYY74_04290 [Candidatus Woesearchaeota archaeon]|nr:hypothetical protein [Candidatus Woesearchaeota archaeon]